VSAGARQARFDLAGRSALDVARPVAGRGSQSYRSSDLTGREAAYVIFLVVFGVPLILLVAICVRLDRRDRSRGRSRGGWGLQNEALQNRMDIDAVHAPPVQGGSMDWATYRARDHARNVKSRRS